MSDNNLITTAQAAKILGITPNTLRQWVYRKKITPVYPGLFDPETLNQITTRKPGRKPKEQTK